ncbi:DUF4012 domain-containing protein [Candidatus Parcubacteria bacterium]|nr:DUF4012 domain-containing protein [Candidatus Parcubacteria bacterium]
MQTIKNKSNIKIKGNNSPSPFLLDLNKEKKKNCNKNSSSDFYDFLDSIDDFNFSNFLNDYSKYTKIKLIKLFEFFKKQTENFNKKIKKAPKIKSEKLDLAFHKKNNKFHLFFKFLNFLKNNKEIKQLALYQIIKIIYIFSFFVIKNVFIFCYRIYLGIVFTLKFSYFFTYFTIRRCIFKIPSFREYFGVLKNDIILAKQSLNAKKLERNKTQIKKQRQNIILKQQFETRKNIKKIDIKKERKNYFKNFINYITDIVYFISKLFPRPSFNALKSSLAFGLILFILIIPFKAFTYYYNFKNLEGRVLGVTESAINDLKSATISLQNKEFDEANLSFTKAGIAFEDAKNEVAQISKVLDLFARIIPNEKIKMASESDLILSSGIISSEIASLIAQSLDYWNNKEGDSIKEIINYLDPKIDEISILIEDLKNKVSQINKNVIPEKYKDYIILLNDKLSIIDRQTKETRNLFKIMRVFLGLEYDKKYLLVFQNNTEIRASGGFIGSFAVVDIGDGEIKDMDIPGGGSYDTEGGLYERIIAPKPLHIVNPLWHFWDANWWPDWKLSAQKLEWFYERSGKTTVDGIIGFTPTVIEKLLNVIGPIDMKEKYGVIINSENFWIITQTYSEQKEDITNKPKKIIGDLMNEIILEIPKRIDKAMFLDILKITEESLSEKHILVYSHDNEVQEFMIKHDFAGELKETNSDYLMVVNTNIAGGKSDKDIQEEIYHDTEILEDGSIINTVTIKRIHTAKRGTIFTGVRNNSWLRVYVPQGSQFLDADGFSIPDKKYFSEPNEKWKNDPQVMDNEGRATIDVNTKTKIYNESGKTVFANWTQLDPEEEIEVYFKYKLPFKFEEDTENDKDNKSFKYSLLVQKQPGSIGSKFESNISYHKNFKLTWSYPENLDIKNDEINFNSNLKTDKFYSVLFENLK